MTRAVQQAERHTGPFDGAGHLVVRADVTLSNKPLQQSNATPFRSNVGLCRDAAGFARGSSRP
jgi:hypothetical protein